MKQGPKVEGLYKRGSSDLAGHLPEITDIYRGIPSGRLVVLGRAGSGKSVLAVRFVLDLLKTLA